MGKGRERNTYGETNEFSIREREGERAFMGKQMTFWKDKWASGEQMGDRIVL